jgi:hypothetical protein
MNGGNKMPDLTTKQKGNVTELLCLLAFTKAGYKVSIPYGEDCRYDLVVDINNKLYRIQCKTSRSLDDPEDGFRFKTKSTVITSHGTKESSYNSSEIDYFATVYEGQCYLVPVDECGKEKTLRYRYPKNGQKKGISLAENYKLDKIIERLE